MSEKSTHGHEYKDVKFLIVDDDQVCVMAIKRALKQMKVVNPVRVAGDGLEALAILRGDEGQSPFLPPYIILLDLNMPRMNGHEFLEEVRADPRLRRALIFVLTTSDAPKDIHRAYEKNIAGYVIKEQPFQSLVRALELIDDIGKLVVLPA